MAKIKEVHLSVHLPIWQYKNGNVFCSQVANNVVLCLQVVMLQKYYRRWLARKYVQKVRLDTEHRLEWERQEELRKKNEKEERIRREFERRMNPKTREDFDLLYHALESEWKPETGKFFRELWRDSLDWWCVNLLLIFTVSVTFFFVEE